MHSSCVGEDESDEVRRKQERVERLGFRPQTEVYCNRLLHNADQLDDESQLMLVDIKDTLAKCVALGELKPTTVLYLNRLKAYIKLYGMKFSKEDHINFIKLLLALINIPTLDPAHLKRFCSSLSQLIRKSTWITPEELQIEWRPLYDLCKVYVLKNTTKADLHRYSVTSNNANQQHLRQGARNIGALMMEMWPRLANQMNMPSLDSDDDDEDENMQLSNTIQVLVRQCSVYFPKESAREIYEEIFPKLFPLDTGKQCDTIIMLSLFVNHSHNYDLWFPKIMDIWDTYHYPSWNADAMNLISGLSYENIGIIDWEPYTPMMFTRFLRSLELPVCYKNMKSSRCQSLYAQSIANWIVSTLGPNSSTQSQLKQFLGVLESYLHPANSGKWVTNISDVLVNLVKCFNTRLIRERYKIHPWKRPISDSHKLTENCITAFVEDFKPIAYQAVYSRMNPSDVYRIFKFLADLRPEIIIPGVIERVYQTLDTLTEPHKMTASLQSLISVSRALVTGNNGYTVGKTHVIPILFAALPGIDSNDFRKTAITLEFLTSFALLVPIIDCSKAGHLYDDLTEEESLLCDQTAEFEGFVHQFMDKIFNLIEASSLEAVRMDDNDSNRSRLENLVEASLHSSTHGILGQCSPDIIRSATRKLIDFIKEHQFEPRVAGMLMASILRVFARLPEAELGKLFVPYLIQRINDYINDHEDIDTIDKQSDEFKYYIILLTSVVRGNPVDTIGFVNDVIPIIDRISKFRCKYTNRYSNAILLNILVQCSSMQTIEVRSSPESFERPLEEFLPIRHWGCKSNAPLNWYIPDKTSQAVCQMLIHRYLPPLLDSFNKYVAGELELTRDEILRDLSTVLALLKCPNMLPNWTNEEPIHIIDSCVNTLNLQINLGFEDLAIHMLDGENVRLAVIKCISKVQDKILQENEDDIKSQKALTLIWERVHMRKQVSTPYDTQQKNFNALKTFQEYSLTRKKRDIRAILATRVMMQQDLRDELSIPNFTNTHLLIMQKLLTLSTSHYSVIRSMAQTRLFTMMKTYRHSEKCIMDDVVRYMALDPETHHEAFKGILHVVGGARRSQMILSKDWDTIERLWLALLKTKLPEKLSLLKLLDKLITALRNEFPFLLISAEVSSECIERALRIAHTPNLLTPDEISAGKVRAEQTNALNLKTYNNILQSIVEITNNSSLHWRFGLMASEMINFLVHPMVKFPVDVVRYSVHNLINDSFKERKIAVHMLRFILKQQKSEHIKIPCDPFAVAKLSRPDDPITYTPGIRPDNRWLQYGLDTVPRCQEDWDEPRYLFKNEGFFGWTNDFQVYAPSSQQPNIHCKPDEMNDCKRVIFEFFSDAANVDKLVKFWSIEEKRGQECFNRNRCLVIKGVTDAFGPRIVELLLPHVERLIRVERNLEPSHRCATELLSGIIRGMKHWPYKETQELAERLKPMIRLALSSTTTETDVFWGICFATAAENFDPQRQYWLHEVLMEDPLRQLSSSVDCTRIYCLQGPYNQHVWRMCSMSHRVLNYVRPHLNHQFQNVRERLGSILINVFELDLHFKDGAQTESPRIKEFLAEVLEKIAILNEEYPPTLSTTSLTEAIPGADAQVAAKTQNAEYEAAVRLFKTVSQWLIGVLNRNTNGNLIEYFDLLPIACRLERCDQDTELANACASLLALISQALTLPACMSVALQKIDEVSQMPSWSARQSVAGVLQVLVFNNMPIVLDNAAWVEQVQAIVLRLLEDPVLEVREKAAEVLGGLLHCSVLPGTDKLLELFKKKCRTKVLRNGIRKPNGTPVEAQDAEAMRRRHMGVLGLCSFISAFPYELPDFVPDVFEHLGAHLNDPPPISSTIRKTVGDFKRTHHDNWATHQLKFTETQLEVLSDLTIPPSYYA